MKKTLIAALVLSVVSSFFMVLFYFASVDIYHEYVNEKSLIYLNTLKSIGNLPEWATMKGLWLVTEIDYLIRFIFMIIVIGVIMKLIYTTKGTVTSFFVLLALGLISFAFMVFYFLASSDIYKDYVNNNIVTAVYTMVNVEPLPVWTNCAVEWLIVKIDFILRAIFMLFINVVLVKWILAKNKQVVPLK